jgi:hypothetical protein
MAYKKVTEFERFRENPFIEKAIEDIRIVKKTQVLKPKNRSEIQMIVSDHGEVQGYSQFLRFVEVEEAQFAKVYLAQFNAFWELSKAAIRVFGYIISILKPKQDSFILRMEACLTYTGYKHRKDVITGISSLIESGIIARSDYSDEFFINPLVVFNGDRVTFAKTYIKKKKEANPNQLNLLNEIGLERAIDEFERKS